MTVLIIWLNVELQHLKFAPRQQTLNIEKISEMITKIDWSTLFWVGNLSIFAGNILKYCFI